MEPTDHKPESDITQEPYKGPGALVTGAGEGVVAHYGLALAGLILGTGLTYLFHGGAGPKFNALRENALKWSESEAKATRLFGKFASSVLGAGEGIVQTKPEMAKALADKAIRTREHGFGLWLLEHTVGFIPPIGKRLKTISDRTTTAVGVGGILGFAGFFLSPIYFLFTGAKHANDGKQQFERAKDEIRTQRAENEALRQRYVEAKIELEELKTTKATETSTLKVAPDNPIMAPADASVAKDSPTVITAPKIEGPPAQGPSPTSPIPKNQWGDGKEQPIATVMARDAVAERVQANEAALSEAL